MRNPYIYIAIMAGVSYLIRTLPLTLIRKEIKSPFIRSFLYYVPYVTLAVMTFPAITEATNNPIAGVLALIVGIILSWCGRSLFIRSRALLPDCIHRRADPVIRPLFHCLRWADTIRRYCPANRSSFLDPGNLICYDVIIQNYVNL